MKNIIQLNGLVIANPCTWIVGFLGLNKVRLRLECIYGHIAVPVHLQTSLAVLHM